MPGFVPFNHGDLTRFGSLCQSFPQRHLLLHQILFAPIQPLCCLLDKDGTSEKMERCFCILACFSNPDNTSSSYARTASRDKPYIIGFQWVKFANDVFCKGSKKPSTSISVQSNFNISGSLEQFNFDMFSGRGCIKDQFRMNIKRSCSKIRPLKCVRFGHSRRCTLNRVEALSDVSVSAVHRGNARYQTLAQTCESGIHSFEKTEPSVSCK
ncbi:MAG: Uncharacterised protein [Candidatus Poseidoniaceae archaeon]|nr:MAG: Uncharacterised protein [Candidatus Poseidoniaceae archaeon]